MLGMRFLFLHVRRSTHVPDRTFLEHRDDFLLQVRDGLRERLEYMVVSPFARETIKRALESGSNDRMHDALVLVTEELGIDWTAKQNPVDA